ncbi:heat shock protein 26-like [Condylostylus longicornis]|uniref:heat shock protein 26-like n=1 Tax=Condylostylus longicornis TaxID=2530218 RepID=UPI00244DF727|nr:heat shock protein 26-like [Condylostylus longicornis]
MALIPRPLDPLEPFEIIDRLDFWDRLRHWRALDYFDSLIPSFFAPLVPSRILSAPPPKVVRSKSMTHLQVGQEIVSRDGFEIQLDVIRFKPSEIEVRIVEDCIVVEGKQEEKWDSKTTTKSFENRYSLPIGYDPWQVTATCHNGILTIRAPPPTRSIIKCHRRFIPIKHI